MLEAPIQMHTESIAIETDRYLAVSAKLDLSDINWAEGAAAGLTDDEVFILTYFSDIEGQTIVYLRDLLSTKASLEPDVAGFLTMWNYEEFFHGKALAQLLKVCGKDLGASRTSDVRKSARISEMFQAWGASLLSRIYDDEFPAVHMAWGAVQEITTLRGYEELARLTRNPVLKVLCDRIAKQERRHFAWYFNSAKVRLSRSAKAQKLTRRLLSNFWTPVGAGVKSDDEVKRLLSLVFPGERAGSVALDIDAKIGNLPGLDDVRLMRRYVEETF
jgi:hypothetical protein